MPMDLTFQANSITEETLITMSERYSKCAVCKGMGAFLKRDPILLRNEEIECGSCGGTGLSGNALDYVAQSQAKDKVLIQTQTDTIRDLRIS